MSDKSSSRRLLLVLGALLVLLGFGGYALYRRQSSAPDATSPQYQEMVTAFYVGLAAMQSVDDARAAAAMTKATQLMPQEPAAWANLGLQQLRSSNLETAAQTLAKAQSLAPHSPEIEKLLALLESQQGKPEAAIAHWKRAIELNPKDLKARYALAKQIEQQSGPTAPADEKRLYDEILQAQPHNLVALLENARLAGRGGDAKTLQSIVQTLTAESGGWPASAQEQLRELRQAVASSNLRLAATDAQFLRNVLAPVAAYQQGLEAVATGSTKISQGAIGDPLEQFLSLPPASPLPAAPDNQLSFTLQPLPVTGTGRSASIAAFWLASQAPNGICRVNNGPNGVSLLPAMTTFFHQGPGVFVTQAQVAQLIGSDRKLPFPGGATASPDGVLGLDINYDFLTDLVFAGAGGLKIYKQTTPGAFKDVTAPTKLPPAILNGNYYGAWAIDIEADGDMDILLAPQHGAPFVLRNNADGTFTPMRPFSGLQDLRGFAGADFDHDGDTDAVLLDAAGALHYFTNDRSGQFHARALPATLGKVLAITAADVNRDGVIDLVALQAGGTILRISDKDDGANWQTAPLATWSGAAKAGSGARLFVADLDNNGSPDIIASGGGGGQVWLSDAAGKFAPLPMPLPADIYSVVDLNSDGRLDLVGLTPTGQPVRLINKGVKNYSWMDLWPEGCDSKDATGDKRINSFGIGGEMEIRSGLLAQKNLILGPVAHFGLGERKGVDVVRMVWPNGAPQAEFGMTSNQALLAKQRLTGSCPFLFAWDGKRINFVKDCNWRSPLGLRINGQATAGVAQTQDWVKVRRDQLVPKDGYYDLRVTADLWEAHFFDAISLMAVDHPVGTEVWVDERFAMPMPPLGVIATAAPHPVTRAWDDLRHDVTDIVRNADGRYLDTFGRGPYQGITRDHYVEVELGPEVPRTGPLWLLAEGWLHPTDSSINVAISQGQHTLPRDLSLEVADGKGGWIVAKPHLGFPAGKLKTITINLEGVFHPGAPRRFRLRTNLEIYWDQLAWAVGLPPTTFKSQRLMANVANLRYRGFNTVAPKNISSPELPDAYDHITQTSQRWRDLIGYYTRFGDVRELLTKADDRYVIMNAGDELALRFPAPLPPPAGWVRDFVFISDGWTKDGNLNTGFSKTLLPLPSHDQPNLGKPPGRLQDDPVYRRHPHDWQHYQTRYVTPRDFQNALRPIVTG